MRKRLWNFRWTLCLALAALALTGGLAEAAGEPIKMKVVVDGNVLRTVGYGETIIVCAGQTVVLEPAHTFFFSPNFEWQQQGKLGVVSKASRLTVKPDTKGEIGYTCTVIGLKGKEFAQITLNVIEPLTVGLTGLETLTPGVSSTFWAQVDGIPEGFKLPRYEWQIVDARGNQISQQYGFIWDFSYTVKAGEDAWMLDGARVICTATTWPLYQIWPISILTATSPAFPSKGLTVPIVVTPAKGDENERVDAVERNGYVIATLNLGPVLGGNAPAENLAYQWQWRPLGSTNDNAWADAGGVQGKSFSVSVPVADWPDSTKDSTKDREYRCLVARAGTTPLTSNSTISGTFDVLRKNVRIVLSDDVTLDPVSGVLITGSEPSTMGLKVTLLESADDGGVVDYAFTILCQNGNRQWVPLEADPSKDVDLEDGSPISVNFLPLSGTHNYRLLVSSSNGAATMSVLRTVSLVSTDKDATGVVGYSTPAEDKDGKIIVEPNESISYNLAAWGGTGEWLVTWKNGAGVSFEGRFTSTDSEPVHDSAVSANLRMVGHDGKPVEGLSFDVTFGTPYVNLTWADGVDFSGKTFTFDEISDDASFDLITLAAAGGKRSGYKYSFSTGDQAGSWVTMKDGTFDYRMSWLGHDFSDGDSASFTFWFKATDGEQTTEPESVTLRVVTVPSVVIFGAPLSGDAYEISFEEGADWSGLWASFVGGSWDETPDIAYTWTWDDGSDPMDGPFWILPGDWEPGDYTATVSAKADDGTELAPATVIVHVTEPEETLTAGASLNRSQVVPGGSVVLTVGLEILGSGQYDFRAGFDPENLKVMTPVAGGKSATLTLTAPTAEGRHPIYWLVEDTASGDADSGIELLTVDKNATPLIKFSIYPESGSKLAVGESFNMMVESLGTQTVTASDLTWASGNTNATVNAGRVSILRAGDVSITATYKGQTATYAVTIPEQGEQVYSIVIPSLIFEAGKPVDAQFETKPAGATFSYTGKLPGELALSSGGRLTGTAPGRGTYTIESVTVTWPDGHSETRNKIPVVVSGESGGGGGGGGCNSGFGILAFALSAFLALKRR